MAVAHINPFTGLRCDCPWGRRKPWHRMASQAVRAIRNQNQKAFRTEKGEQYLRALESLAGDFPGVEPMIPWLAHQYKKGEFTLDPDNPESGQLHWHPYESPHSVEKPEPRPVGVRILNWIQWMNARQHPLRRGVNIMEKDPREVDQLGRQLQVELDEKNKRERWLDDWRDNSGAYAHTFDPSHARNSYEEKLLDKHKGWKVYQLNNDEHAEAESHALGHCIGADGQDYKRAIDDGIIEAYSLRDQHGFPKVTWHFNPDGTLAHIQGRSGYPDEDRRDLISIFNEAHGKDDDNGGHGHEHSLGDEWGDDVIDLPGPEDHQEYFHQYQPNAELWEGAENYGNVGDQTIINPGIPDFEQIYDSLRDANPQDRNDFYHTVLYNHHTHMPQWQNEVNARQDRPDQLEPIDHRIQQEWQQALDKSHDPQTGTIVPPNRTWENDPGGHGNWRWDTAWEGVNTPLFMRGTEPGTYWYQNAENFPRNLPGVLPASQQMALNMQQAQQGRQANILDPIHDILPPTVWEDSGSPEPKLKSAHRRWLLRTLMQHAAKFEDNPEQWASFILTGSLTTYQYSDTSDCDVSLFVDPHTLPEWSRAKLIGVMIDNFDGVKLPGTPYEMQCFVVARNISKADLYQQGLRSGYDILAEKWLVPPDRTRSHDVAREQNADYIYALESADKMERLLRYEPDKAVQFWHQIHKRRMRDQRAGKGDYSQANVVYKFLANRGLFPAISEASGEYIA